MLQDGGITLESVLLLLDVTELGVDGLEAGPLGLQKLLNLLMTITCTSLELLEDSSQRGIMILLTALRR